MKFSHALKFNANSAWKDHYINYNRLKKLIYKKEAEETQGMSLNMPDIANRTSIGRTPSSSLLSPFSTLLRLLGPPVPSFWQASSLARFSTGRT